MTVRLRLTVLLVALAACAAPREAPRPAAVPTHLRLSIGNGLDGYTRVVLVGDTLVHSQTGPPSPSGPPPPVRVVPGVADWAAFRAALDRAGAFAWQARYENPLVADGTLWSVEVEYADRSVRASGANRYPGPGGAPRDGVHGPRVAYTAEFDAVLAAVRSLTGQPFE